MGTIAKSVIRDMIRDRADIVGDTVRHTNADLDQHILDSLTRLQGILIQKGLLTDETVDTLTADGSTSYALPADYLATVAIFRQDQSEYNTPLRRFSAKGAATLQAAHEGEATMYRTFISSAAKKVQFYPEPQTGTYYHVYVPLLTLASDGATLDASMVWHEYIISDVARIVYRKDNLDPIGFIQDRELALRQIEDLAEAQDLMDTHTVEDVYGSHCLDEGDWRWIRDGGY